ncbi:MAG: M20/M25/M40 family metallo-hydrolase [Tissierellia bacterium]|nr:M20/M25/M40 family metallo-hydrolase [Tissierellia bacterium]
MDNHFYDEVEKITKDLVSIESIVKNGSESDVARYIYDYYQELDYFRENPELLIFQKTKDDQIERHNTICLLKGEKENTKETIVLMGHIDTVGVEDYSYIKEYAFTPDELLEKLKLEDLDAETYKDLQSGDYMFGRGVLDMKSGVAVQMAIIKYFSENLDKLNGNIIAIAECDEEDSSHGIISALDILNSWKIEYELNYLVAINSDFTTPMYEGDENRYVYLGTVGKLLPSFYIAGVETHVGKAFSGLDPNMIASEINKKLNLNTKYCDIGQGETTLPPVCLQLRDLKPEYDVQTPMAANSYYNYSTHSATPLDVIEKMRDLARDSADSVLEYINEEYKKWCQMTNSKYSKIDWNLGVYTWNEYEEKLIDDYGERYINHMEEFKKKLDLEYPDMSITEFSLKIIHEAYSEFSKGDDPAIIIYYGSPYYQNVEILGQDEREIRIIKSIKNAISLASDYTDDKIQLRYFYPYISDSSFMFLPREDSGIKSFEENFPAWGIKYKHPVEKIKKISMPVINIGTFGNDGHKFTERVHKTYTFEILPKLILGFLNSLL